MGGSLFSQQVTVRKATGYTGSRLCRDVSKLDLNTTLKERQLAVCLPRTQVPESGFSFAFPKYHGFYVQY